MERNTTIQTTFERREPLFILFAITISNKVVLPTLLDTRDSP